MDTTLNYKTKISYVLRIAPLFVIFTALSIFIGLNPGSSKLNPALVIILIGLYIGYISRVISDNSKAKLLQISLSFLGIVIALSIFIFFGDIAVLLIGTSFFGILGSYYAWLNLVKRQPVIHANEKYLLLNNGFLKGKYFEIPWRQVDRLTIVSQNHFAGITKYLVVKLVDPEQFKQTNNSWTLGKVMDVNEQTIGGHLAVTISNLNANEHDILSSLKKYKNTLNLSR